MAFFIKRFFGKGSKNSTGTSGGATVQSKQPTTSSSLTEVTTSCVHESRHTNTDIDEAGLPIYRQSSESSICSLRATPLHQQECSERGHSRVRSSGYDSGLSSCPLRHGGYDELPDFLDVVPNHYGINDYDCMQSLPPPYTSKSKPSLEVNPQLRLEDVVISGHTLGTGSYGEVRLATCHSLPVAAKSMHSVLEKSPRSAAKFENEIETLSSLRHPNIVEFMGVYMETDGCPYIIMELVEGGSLYQFVDSLHGDSIVVRHWQKVRIGLDISLALEYLHSKHVIHRDLSSSNVLLTSDHRAKVSDFGMSRLFSVPSMQPSTLVPGCPSYMPPEALIYGGWFTEKGDVLSFAVLLMELINAEHPRPLSTESHEPERRRRDCQQFCDQAPEALRALTMQCLEHDPKDRPTAKEINRELKEYLDSLEKEKGELEVGSSMASQESEQRCSASPVVHCGSQSHVVSPSQVSEPDLHEGSETEDGSSLQCSEQPDTSLPMATEECQRGKSQLVIGCSTSKSSSEKGVSDQESITCEGDQVSGEDGNHVFTPIIPELEPAPDEVQAHFETEHMNLVASENSCTLLLPMPTPPITAEQIKALMYMLFMYYGNAVGVLLKHNKAYLSFSICISENPYIKNMGKLCLHQRYYFPCGYIDATYTVIGGTALVSSTCIFASCESSLDSVCKAKHYHLSTKRISHTVATPSALVPASRVTCPFVGLAVQASRSATHKPIKETMDTISEFYICKLLFPRLDTWTAPKKGSSQDRGQMQCKTIDTLTATNLAMSSRFVEQDKSCMLTFQIAFSVRANFQGLQIQRNSIFKPPKCTDDNKYCKATLKIELQKYMSTYLRMPEFISAVTLRGGIKYHCNNIHEHTNLMCYKYIADNRPVTFSRAVQTLKGLQSTLALGTSDAFCPLEPVQCAYPKVGTVPSPVYYPHYPKLRSSHQIPLLLPCNSVVRTTVSTVVPLQKASCPTMAQKFTAMGSNSIIQEQMYTNYKIALSLTQHVHPCMLQQYLSVFMPKMLSCCKAPLPGSTTNLFARGEIITPSLLFGCQQICRVMERETYYTFQSVIVNSGSVTQLLSCLTRFHAVSRLRIITTGGHGEQQLNTSIMVRLYALNHIQQPVMALESFVREKVVSSNITSMAASCTPAETGLTFHTLLQPFNESPLFLTECVPQAIGLAQLNWPLLLSLQKTLCTKQVTYSMQSGKVARSWNELASMTCCTTISDHTKACLALPSLTEDAFLPMYPQGTGVNQALPPIIPEKAPQNHKNRCVSLVPKPLPWEPCTESICATSRERPTPANIYLMLQSSAKDTLAHMYLQGTSIASAAGTARTASHENHPPRESHKKKKKTGSSLAAINQTLPPHTLKKTGKSQQSQHFSDPPSPCPPHADSEVKGDSSKLNLQETTALTSVPNLTLNGQTTLHTVGRTCSVRKKTSCKRRKRRINKDSPGNVSKRGKSDCYDRHGVYSKRRKTNQKVTNQGQRKKKRKRRWNAFDPNSFIWGMVSSLILYLTLKSVRWCMNKIGKKRRVCVKAATKICGQRRAKARRYSSSKNCERTTYVHISAPTRNRQLNPIPSLVLWASNHARSFYRREMYHSPIVEEPKTALGNYCSVTLPPENEQLGNTLLLCVILSYILPSPHKTRLVHHRCKPRPRLLPLDLNQPVKVTSTPQSGASSTTGGGSSSPSSGGGERSLDGNPQDSGGGGGGGGNSPGDAGDGGGGGNSPGDTGDGGGKDNNEENKQPRPNSPGEDEQSDDEESENDDEEESESDEEESESVDKESESVDEESERERESDEGSEEDWPGEGKTGPKQESKQVWVVPGKQRPGTECQTAQYGGLSPLIYDGQLPPPQETHTQHPLKSGRPRERDKQNESHEALAPDQGQTLSDAVSAPASDSDQEAFAPGQGQISTDTLPAPTSNPDKAQTQQSPTNDYLRPFVCLQDVDQDTLAFEDDFSQAPTQESGPVPLRDGHMPGSINEDYDAGLVTGPLPFPSQYLLLLSLTSTLTTGEEESSSNEELESPESPEPQSGDEGERESDPREVDSDDHRWEAVEECEENYPHCQVEEGNNSRDKLVDCDLEDATECSETTPAESTPNLTSHRPSQLFTKQQHSNIATLCVPTPEEIAKMFPHEDEEPLGSPYQAVQTCMGPGCEDLKMDDGLCIRIVCLQDVDQDTLAFEDDFAQAPTQESGSVLPGSIKEDYDAGLVTGLLYFPSRYLLLLPLTLSLTTGEDESSSSEESQYHSPPESPEPQSGDEGERESDPREVGSDDHRWEAIKEDHRWEASEECKENYPHCRVEEGNDSRDNLVGCDLEDATECSETTPAESTPNLTSHRPSQLFTKQQHSNIATLCVPTPEEIAKMFPHEDEEPLGSPYQAVQTCMGPGCEDLKMDDGLCRMAEEECPAMTQLCQELRRNGVILQPSCSGMLLEAYLRWTVRHGYSTFAAEVLLRLINGLDIHMRWNIQFNLQVYVDVQTHELMVNSVMCVQEAPLDCLCVENSIDRLRLLLVRLVYFCPNDATITMVNMLMRRLLRITNSSNDISDIIDRLQRELQRHI